MNWAFVWKIQNSNEESFWIYFRTSNEKWVKRKERQKKMNHHRMKNPHRANLTNQLSFFTIKELKRFVIIQPFENKSAFDILKVQCVLKRYKIFDSWVLSHDFLKSFSHLSSPFWSMNRTFTSFREIRVWKSATCTATIL